MAPRIENDKVFITLVYPESPAAKADIHNNDAIIAIDHFPVSQASKMKIIFYTTVDGYVYLCVYR
jgi:C-terminal processing protease CtpA/Prc